MLGCCHKGESGTATATKHQKWLILGQAYHRPGRTQVHKFSSAAHVLLLAFYYIIAMVAYEGIAPLGLYSNDSPTFFFSVLGGALSPQRSGEAQCESGAYCVAGRRRLCPAGTFGVTPGLASPTCTGVCPAGNYCPEGTVEPIPCPAGTYGGTRPKD